MKDYCVTGIVALLSIVGSSRSDEVLPRTTMAIKEAAVVRGAPSENDLATMKLPIGAKVVVLGFARNYPDWVEIEPPAGSRFLAG